MVTTSREPAGLLKNGQQSRRPTGWRRAVLLYRRDILGMIGITGLLMLAVLGILAPVIAEYPGSYGSFEAINVGPSREYWFGTDELGRGIFDQTIFGIRSSFYVAAIATVIATLVGILVGMLSGFFSGLVGEIFTSLIDVFLTLPLLPMMILLASVLSPGLTTTALVIGVFAWPATARIVRAEVVRLRNVDYVEAAHVVGVTDTRILSRHILPNAAPPIFINLSFVAGSAIIAEAGLAFLGLGNPTNWSWGTVLSHAQSSGRFLDSWWYATFPSLFIAVTVVSLNLFGQAMNEVLNPRVGK